MKRIILGILFILTLPVFLVSQEWLVPADKQGRLSPFLFTDSTRSAGMQLFNLNCMSCHGTPGKGNFQHLIPPPGDPATEKIQHNSDGEIFYKVTEGKSPMPSFKNTLSTKDIWNIISYIRSFNHSYKQSVMPEIISGAYPGARIWIKLMLNPGKDSVKMKVSAIKANSSVPVTGAGVRLFVKRTFGQLPLGEEETTNAEGVAAFSISPALPGDTVGNILVLARFTDEEKFGSAGKDTLLQAGVKITPVSLTKDRAMWNVVRKAPIWILLTYSLGALLVWGFILFVLLKLRDIYIIGEYFDHEKKEEV
jgi:hypothetical protein